MKTFNVGYKGKGMCEHCNQSYLSTGTDFTGHLYCSWYHHRKCKTVARNCVHGIKGLKEPYDPVTGRMNRKSQPEKNVIIHEIKNENEQDKDTVG